MAMTYNATNPADIHRLAVNLATTPSADYWRVMGHVYGMGLMRFHGPMAWAFRLARLKGKTGPFQFFKILQDRFPDTVKDCMLSTIEHVCAGTDTEDAKSVGGWSQREIDLFTAKVKFSNDGVTP